MYNFPIFNIATTVTVTSFQEQGAGSRIQASFGESQNENHDPPTGDILR